jgi:uncharacterized membrane protein YfcA
VPTAASVSATTLGSLSGSALALLVVAAFAAGWIDAVVGGGGLIQLPALLLVPGMGTVQALATNKISSAMGTSVSAVTYYRRVRPGLGTALPMAGVAALGSAGGALSAAAVPSGVLQPVVLVALVVVAVYTLLRPSVGGATDLRFGGHRHTFVAAVVGAVIGFYDGIAGPGTGAFLVFALVGLVGYAFLEASATAKIVNLATNVGALVVFALHGAVLWPLGLGMGLANLTGGYLGARMAVGAGSRFVRVVFLLVVGVLIVRLAWQVLQG